MTYMKHLKKSNLQKVEWWLPGTDRRENGELLFDSFSLANEKVPLHNNMDVLKTTDLNG